MKTLSSGLQFTLRDLVGTPVRFTIVLLCQVLGFVLTVFSIGLSVGQIADLAFWGLLTPVCFLICLRRLVLQLQKESVHDNRSPNYHPGKHDQREPQAARNLWVFFCLPTGQ